MELNRPGYLASGEPARLIPTHSDSNKELRSTSILLAAMMAVPPFSKRLLASLGVRCGKTTKVEAYTEVTFSKGTGKSFRPDGLIIVRTAKNEWRALVEAKSANAVLDPKQLQHYLDLSKEFGIDALITISDQLATLPNQHPNAVELKKPKHVDLFHWAWTYTLTEATLLIAEDEFDDPEQRYILSEVARYFKSSASGLNHFDRMNSEWKDFVSAVQNRVPLSEASSIIQSSVASLHQEQRDVCLLMSRKLCAPVEQKLSRKHSLSQEDFFKDNCLQLAAHHTNDFSLQIPNAASLLNVKIDAARRNISCSMELEAPHDKKTTKARVNWLVRQLKDTTGVTISIRAHWPGRAAPDQRPLTELMENPDLFSDPDKGKPVKSFEILMTDDLGADFGRTTKFISRLEVFIPSFYQLIGQNLRAWKPAPPEILAQDTGTDENELNAPTPEAPMREAREAASHLSLVAAMSETDESLSLPWSIDRNGQNEPTSKSVTQD